MSDESEVLITFDLELYKAPNITASYILLSSNWGKIKAKLTKYEAREHFLGELEGKHSETRFTGKELLSGATVIEDQAKMDAFKLLHPRNSYDIIDRLQEIWACDFSDAD